MVKINPSEITPEQVYLSRRKFMTGMGALAVSSLILAACGVPQSSATSAPAGGAGPTAGVPDVTLPPLTGSSDELGAKLTTFEAVTNFNNFYEFTTNKEGVARLAQNFQTVPWTITVGGLVQKPRTFGLEDLFKFTQEERIYRLRCVEAWSMVIPWVGFPLSKLLNEVEPMAQAKYVRFETLYNPEEMPGQKRSVLQWPYVEGLRMDEALHPLTLLAVGLYGKDLPSQNGAPLRLVVPWKYGFKGIKSIVRIKFVQSMPPTSWNISAPDEYGFYSNVNPEVDHPRWSQKTERRIGEFFRRKTLMFNGYGDQVASMYSGMDLKRNF